MVKKSFENLFVTRNELSLNLSFYGNTTVYNTYVNESNPILKKLSPIYKNLLPLGTKYRPSATVISGQASKMLLTMSKV